jgi:hypothetical protein
VETTTVLPNTEEQEIEQDLFGEDVFITDTLDEDVETPIVEVAKQKEQIPEQSLPQKVSDKPEEITPAIKVEQPVVITTDEKKPENEKSVVEKRSEEKKLSFWDRIAAPFKSLGNCIVNLFKKLFCIKS